MLIWSFEQLAKKYHPDTNTDPTSKERFLEIQNAYEVSNWQFVFAIPPRWLHDMLMYVSSVYGLDSWR
jgi:hypothetical protein